ncbi:two-component system response regulator [Magnetospirillum sp. SS-4]|uniref:response regulator n=1 Tax=Magnetospirillum sp. SS-4 TaxID=2681465 RepID=UPI001380162B|nr:response regulator [Magnetospirillum sp. SS-4]CAA7626300.1 Response regulator [Magnetospirillum sp. SS-4]
MTTRTACVVIIDANAHMRRLIGSLLAVLPATSVVEARSASAAAPLIQSHDPHLIVMDWSNDHTDELLFVHHLRRGEIGRADIPVLAISASLHHAVLEQADDAGIDEVIAKPISAVEILGRAATLIAQSRHGDNAEAAE